MVSRNEARRTSTVGWWVKKVLWFVSIPVTALVLGFVMGAAILIWGLVTPFFIVWPLALGSSALLAAIGASWAGTVFAPDHTHSRLLRILFVSEVTAAVLVVAFLIAPLILPAASLPPIALFALALVFISVGASVATWRFRSPAEHLGWRVFVSLASSALVLVATLAGLTGALGFFGIWEWTAILLISFINLSVVAAGVILLRRGNWGREGQLARDAAATLGLIGLPAPVFFGAYYLAFVFDMTSG